MRKVTKIKPSIKSNKKTTNPNDVKPEGACKCVRFEGHLEDVKWLLWPRHYKPSPGYLSLGDWTDHEFIWLHYVESNDGIFPDDDVLRSTDTRYWSIHDVQRYYFGDLHCEKVLFTYQYPNIRTPSRLGSYFWKANTALKLPPQLYQKSFNISLDLSLKRMNVTEAQMDKLIICDQLIKVDRLDHYRRKSFFELLMNILSFQDRLQLVSFENLCCKRLEGVRLLQQLACFNADTLKYLFLWRFVLPNENPLLINYSYITELVALDASYRQPKTYVARILGEHFQPRQQTSRAKPNPETNEQKTKTEPDPKRPWRTNSNKEKLLRIDSELKQHLEKASQLIEPMCDQDMMELVKTCREETLASAPVSANRLQDTVDAARRNLTNFQYRKIDNTTATSILPAAHLLEKPSESHEDTS